MIITKFVDDVLSGPVPSTNVSEALSNSKRSLKDFHYFRHENNAVVGVKAILGAIPYASKDITDLLKMKAVKDEEGKFEIDETKLNKITFTRTGDVIRFAKV